MQTQNKEKKHWAALAAEETLAKFPDRDVYVCAGGISPSGVMHFGNLRDGFTAYAVYLQLQKVGKKARIIYSIDDFDRLRKVPEGVDESFSKYIGMPLSRIPAPDGSKMSYSEYFFNPFKKALSQYGLEMEYIQQTKEYESGRYNDKIKQCLLSRKKIACILLSFMTEKMKSAKNIDENVYIENYYPVGVYSRFTGKDTTKVLSYDGGDIIEYECLETGQKDKVDITKDGLVKLPWKIDWAMRWQAENVSFEPGGKDHSSAGGSFDVGKTLAKEIFDFQPPVYLGYDFVGIQGQGGKMSGSSGKSVSPQDLLDIYTPEILKWQYTKFEPKKVLTLAFDSEVYRQYSEFDKTVEEYQLHQSTMAQVDILSLELSGVTHIANYKKPIPFRQAVGFGQIVNWSESKMIELLEQIGEDFDESSIKERMQKGRCWLEKYNASEIIEILSEKNVAYVTTMNDSQKRNITMLRTFLKENTSPTIEEINEFVYEVPKLLGEEKENKERQKSFFIDVSRLLIGKDAGPRLATFLWATDNKSKVLELLDINS